MKHMKTKMQMPKFYIIIGIIFFCMILLSGGVSANTAQISIIVNGKQIKPDVQPELISGRVMVPARYIAESLGVEVEWLPEKKAVVIYETEEQRIPSDKIAEATNPVIRIFINGQEITPDVLPQNINGRVMVPARFIVEPLGASVSWDSNGRRVIINTRNIDSRSNSNDIVSPFNPNDIFMFPPIDWYSSDEMSLIKRLHTNVIGSCHGENDWKLGSFYEYSDLISKVTAIAHQAGLKYTAHFSTDMDNHNNSISNEQGIAVKDIYGNTINASAPSENLRVWKSVHYPEWKTYMIEMAKKVVDSGVDIMCIDGWTLNYEVIFKGGDFSDNSMAGFRDYLKNKYSASQLKSFGISDISTFSYADFIKERYLTTYTNGDKMQIPLFNDFADFQLISSRNFWKDIIDETRSYAKETKKDIIITMNVCENKHKEMVPGLPIVDFVDGFMSEYFFKAPPDINSITEYKIFKSLGKPIAFLPNCGAEMGDLLSRSDMTQLMKIYTSEAYATGEFTYVPYAAQANMEKGWKLYSADLNELYPYYDFISENANYYIDHVSTAKTAVLYSYATMRNYQEANYNFFGICNLLLNSHRQYDALFAGDNIWIDDTLTINKLNQYDVIILPNVKDVSDEHVSLILNYIKNGGNVYAFGETATRDESDNAKQRTELNSLLVEGTHQYGLGQFVYEKNDVGNNYLNSKDTNTLNEIYRILETLSNQGIQTNAGQKVSIQEYWNTKLDADIIHLVNYDYDTNNGYSNQQNNIALKVTLNSKLLGQKLYVYFASPDDNSKTELSYSIENNKISFTIPSLSTYGVVYICEKSDS